MLINRAFEWCKDCLRRNQPRPSQIVVSAEAHVPPHSGLLSTSVRPAVALRDHGRILHRGARQISSARRITSERIRSAREAVTGQGAQPRDGDPEPSAAAEYSMHKRQEHDVRKKPASFVVTSLLSYCLGMACLQRSHDPDRECRGLSGSCQAPSG